MNPEHAEVVRGGTRAIEQWREAHPYRALDLMGIDLKGARLSKATLAGADLRNADLRGADLYKANLRYANLQGAILRRATLLDAALVGADLLNADLGDALLDGADVGGAHNLLAIGPYGDTGYRPMLFAVRHDTCVMVAYREFWGTLSHLRRSAFYDCRRYSELIVEALQEWGKQSEVER